MQLKVFYENYSPVYVGSRFGVKVGYYDDYGNLTNVTNSPDLQVTVLMGSSTLRSWNPPGTFQPIAAQTYIVQFTYDPSPNFMELEDGSGTLMLESGGLLELEGNGNNVSTVFYFYAIPSLEFILDTNEIYALIKQEEPANVYSQEADPSSPLYCDNMALATVFSQVYTALDNLLDSFFPETVSTGSAFLSEWEQTVTGQYNQYSPIDSKTPAILQFLRNLNPSLNPFDLSSAISQYIYLRLNLKVFVYVEEFLYKPRAGTWILGTSLLGVDTVLGHGVEPGNVKRLAIHVLDGLLPLPQSIHGEIQHLVYIIIRANTKWDIDYGHVPSDFGLLDNLGNTYKGDPRLGGYYCLQWDPIAVENVNGLTNPYDPGKLISITVFPNSGFVQLGAVISFTCIAYYGRGFSQDVTTKANWRNLTPATLQGTAQKNKYLTIAEGEAQVEARFFGLSYTATLTVTLDAILWFLNISTLNNNTTLG